MGKAVFSNGNVITSCPNCGGAITTYQFKSDSGEEFGTIQTASDRATGTRILYTLMRCAGCGRAGLAKLYANNNYASAILDWFFPASSGSVVLPQGTPEGVRQEYLEASKCMQFGAFRAASALYRSCIEKVLKASGYIEGSMFNKIELAASDGVITEARKRRAHDEVRTLGNDVLHDDWRLVEETEAILSQEYSQRIIEDFYDHRESVEKVLRDKGRIQ